MITNSKNKNIENKDVETKASTEGILLDFFYAGGGEYEPITIKAATQAEAEALYIKKRVAINK